MHWLFLLLGFAAMVVAFKTASSGLMAVCLVAALVLFILWLAGLYSARMVGRSRDASMIIDPAELRRPRPAARWPLRRRHLRRERRTPRHHCRVRRPRRQGRRRDRRVHRHRPALTALSVNLNKIAILRNSRGGGLPDVLQAGSTCLDAGAHGLTVHPRPDARHIRSDDVHALAALCSQRGVEFNIEGNPFAPPRTGYPGLLALCEATRPAQVTMAS